ncbi:MAG: hypothetical protein AB7D51_10565 [Desulfovibrionaceae bacterium]
MDKPKDWQPQGRETRPLWPKGQGGGTSSSAQGADQRQQRPKPSLGQSRGQFVDQPYGQPFSQYQELAEGRGGDVLAAMPANADGTRQAPGFALVSNKRDDRTGHERKKEELQRGGQAATAQSAPPQAPPAPSTASPQEKRADFSGLFDTGKRGGVDRMPEPPGPAPEAVYGTKEFYKWRAEDFKRRHPGKEPPPYYMDYGDKYARVFSDEIRGRLSDKGKQWVDNTRRTLQRRIEEKLASGEMDELDPQEFERMAFAMHSDAYQEAGINDLPFSDAMIILGAVDRSDFFKPASIREGLEVAGPYVGNNIDNELRKRTFPAAGSDEPFDTW